MPWGNSDLLITVIVTDSEGSTYERSNVHKDKTKRWSSNRLTDIFTYRFMITKTSKILNWCHPSKSFEMGTYSAK